MEMVLGIFTKLGVDSTIIYQFVIVAVLFTMLKALFLNRLKEVLSLREERTTKLEVEANKKMNQAQELSNLYRSKMDKCFSDAQEFFRIKKIEIYNSEKEKMDAFEFHVSTEFEKKREDYIKSVYAKKDSVMSHADELSKELMNKLTH